MLTFLGGTVWKENSKFLDVSITKDHLKGARSFLNAHNLMPEILNTNVQELIDMEQMMGANLTQSVPGQRTSKYDFLFKNLNNNFTKP